MITDPLTRRLFFQRSSVALGSAALASLLGDEARAEATGLGRGGWTYDLQYCDYTVEVSTDGKTWKTVVSNEGVTLENGKHVHDFDAVLVSWIRISIKGERYERNQTNAGLAGFQVFRRIQKNNE